MKNFLNYKEYTENPEKVFEKELRENRFNKEEKAAIIRAVIAFEEEAAKNNDSQNYARRAERLIDKDLLIFSSELNGLKGMALSRAILLIITDTLKLKHYSVLYKAINSKLVAASLNVALSIAQERNIELNKQE